MELQNVARSSTVMAGRRGGAGPVLGALIYPATIREVELNTP